MKQQNSTNFLKKWAAANKGVAIAGGKSSIHILYLGRNLYFS